MIRHIDSCIFLNDTATTEIYTLSLHDALPISGGGLRGQLVAGVGGAHLEDGEQLGRAVVGEADGLVEAALQPDRKSTRLNSSHANISYAVFCLKKKKITYSSHTVCLNLLAIVA